MFLSYPPQTQKLVNSISRTQTVDDQSTDKSVRLTFQTTLEELAPLRKGNPKTWARLLDTLGITETGALSFLAFTNVLKKMPSRWYKSDHLFELLKSFCAAYHRPLVPRLEFDLLLELLSCAIKDARSTGVVIPFLRFGNWYRFWFFAYHVLIPGLVFISAIQRQYSEIWSRTFGSEMAVVADYIASLLPTSKKISIMTRREKKGLGDADLVIFDSSSNELLVCELKTVFDRFRTDFQSTNFTLQRVNFDKAIRQLDASCDAIADGRWPLKDLLPNDAIQTMPVIYKLIILWRDIPNPTLDKGSFVPVIDLASFVYLYKQCNGRPREIVETVEQLSKIYMASTYATQSLEVGGEKIEWMREVEIGGLPPLSFIRSLVVSYRTQQEYQTLAHLPEDWTTQLRPDEPSEAFHFRSDLSLNADVI
jgi:hypothetical protein